MEWWDMKTLTHLVEMWCRSHLKNWTRQEQNRSRRNKRLSTISEVSFIFYFIFGYGGGICCDPLVYLWWHYADTIVLVIWKKIVPKIAFFVFVLSKIAILCTSSYLIIHLHICPLHNHNHISRWGHIDNIWWPLWPQGWNQRAHCCTFCWNYPFLIGKVYSFSKITYLS